MAKKVGASGKSSGRKKTLYSVHPGVAMVQGWIAALKDKTGRDLEDWLALIGKEGPKDPKSLREWLKKEHGDSPTRS